jgi:hypothetical protein
MTEKQFVDICMFPPRDWIHIASCAAKENLPTNPKLPADLFTCCLTTPIEMALWFQRVSYTQLTPYVHLQATLQPDYMIISIVDIVADGVIASLVT